MPSSAARAWMSARSSVDMRIFTRRFLVRVARAYSRYRRSEASEVTTDLSSLRSYAERIRFSYWSSLFISHLFFHSYSSVPLSAFSRPRFVLLSNRLCCDPLVGFVAFRFLRG